MQKPLRFHWSLSSAGEAGRGAQSRAVQSGIPNLEALLQFCRRAEACGMDSLLTAFGFHRPDPIVLAAALGLSTKEIKFMVAVRSGIFSPTVFVQQVNTVSALTNGRICLNVVAGHTPEEQRYYGDFLSHDERYERTDEFLTICRAFWERDGEINFSGKYYRIENGRLNAPFVSPERTSPEIYLGGNSPQAEALAIKHAHCVWRLPDTPEKLKPRIEPILETGTEVGLLVSMLARPTRDQALADAYAMIESLGPQPKRVHKEFEQRSDSVAFKSTLALAEASDSAWLTPTLWTGAVPYLGAVAIALVGSAEEVAHAIMEYKSIGITQFLFMGWPDLEEMTYFSRAVLPLIRKNEQEAG
ncbi:MAG: LLM class flavin-dependent oxidoreductase [bacterium]